MSLNDYIPIEFDGDRAGFIQALDDVLATVLSRADDLLSETNPNTSTELFQQWLDAYNLAFDSPDTDADKLLVLLGKLNELGGMSIPYFVNLASRFNQVISIRDSLGFIFNDVFNTVFYGDEHVHSFVLTLTEQHRFPFIFNDVFNTKFVSFDKRNSMEALFVRLKPAQSDIFFHYFNWGFEAGDLSEWIAFSDVIDNVTVRTGTYSAKLSATGSAINGIESYHFVIADNRKYNIDSYHNITAWSAGTYSFEISYYSDLYGNDLISSDTIYSKAATTAGWKQGTKTIAPAGIESDLDFPANAKSFKIKRSGGAGSNFTAYIDDIDISLV